MLSKPTFYRILFITIILIGACKSHQTNPFEYSFLIELGRENSPEEVETLKRVKILEAKPSNRTLNQWLVKISTTIPKEQMLSQLQKEQLVIDVQEINQNPNTTITNSTNEKKGKSKPIKNE